MSSLIKGKNPRKPYTVRYKADGKQRERSFVTLREARDFKIKVDHDVRAHIFVDDRLGRQNFGEAAQRWLDGLARAEQTRLLYANILKVHVLPAFGDRTIAQVAADREGVTALLKVQMARLSRGRREKARHVITAVLDEAVKSGKLTAHKIGGIDLEDDRAGNDHADFVFPAHAQLAKLAAGLNGNGLSVWLMRHAGLRIGEALAVRKDCFLDGGRTLRISEQVLRSGRLGPLKARRAGEFRDIPCPDYLWQMVKGLPDGYLFRRNGKFVSYSAYLQSFKLHAGKAGIPAGFTPHSLRHGFVSALLTRGVPITDVAAWVGHRDISITFGVYGHLVPSAMDRGRAALNEEIAEFAGELRRVTR